MDSLQKRFKEITGFELKERQTNLLSEKVFRKDDLFETLPRLYFEKPKKFKELSKKLLPLILNKRNLSNETLLALAGYIYYIEEDFKKAKNCFLKCINLNPQNLDNLIDLAFTLRHLGDYKLANGILFNYDYIIYYYDFLKLSNVNFTILKDLILLISEKSLKCLNKLPSSSVSFPLREG